MPGTGLYSVKKTPTKLDRTQSGPDSGQTITFTVGGLGTADAYKGGYITNVTQGETRAIVSHIDDAAVLDGDVTAWADTDDLDIFDAWSTIQAALDQLFTDQGTTTFTASQYIRVFAGTYDENVVPSPSLVPDMTNGYPLIIEGDPLAARADVWIAPAGGSIALDVSNDLVLVRHMRIGASENLAAIRQFSSGNSLNIVDCQITAGAHGVHGYSDTNIKDTTITLTHGGAVSAIFANYTQRPLSLTNCILEGTGAGAYLGVSARGRVKMDGVTIRGCATGVSISSWPAGTLALQNCSIHGATEAIKLSMFVGRLAVINSIFSSCVNPLSFPQAWPEESATQLGADVTLRDNNFYDFTDFAKGPSAATKTYAQLIALNQVDAAGDIFTDPLITDPASGDFSLQTASPARNAGHGSGVVTGINDVAFDPSVPDIGAWSSGPFVLDPPVITAISPNFDGDSFGMTVGQTKGRTVKVYTSSEIPSAFALDAATRDGDGDLTVTSKTSGLVYYVYCQTLIGNTVAGTSNVVKVLITDTDTGGIPAAVDEDPSALPGVDILLRDESHDMAVAESDLILVQGSALVKQRLAIILQLFKGEWFLDADAGIPYFQEILEKGVDATVVDAILRSAIIATDGVNRILTYESSIDSAARTITVAFTVDTVYGPVVFEGAIL